MADTVTYAVVVNQPGYLPESDPYYAATLNEAREAAAAEIRYSITELAEMGDTATLAGLTGREIDDMLMAPYDIGPDGGSLPLPGDQGYIVDVVTVW